MRYLAVLFSFVIVMPAYAQTVDLAECKTLAEYVPSADVAYKPGVDAQGKPVVPADLNAVPFEMPDIMTIPLSVDLAKRLPDPPKGVLGEAPLGFLEVHKNGRITYDGQDWTSQVYAICRGEILPPVRPEDGQKAPDAVQSPPVIETPPVTGRGLND